MGTKVTSEDAWNARIAAQRAADKPAEAAARDASIETWKAAQEASLERVVAEAKHLGLTAAQESQIRTLQQLPNKLKAAQEVRRLIEKIEGRIK